MANAIEMQRSAPQSIQTKFAGNDGTDSGVVLLNEESQPTVKTHDSEAASRKNYRHTEPIWASQDNAITVVAEEQANVCSRSIGVVDQSTQKRQGTVQSMLSGASESHLDAASLISHPGAVQANKSTFSYEPVGGLNDDQTAAKDTFVDTITVTAQSRKIRNASQGEDPIEDSNFASYTEMAPSQNDILNVSQKAKVRVDLSSDDCLDQQPPSKNVENFESPTTELEETKAMPQAQLTESPVQAREQKIDKQVLHQVSNNTVDNVDVGDSPEGLAQQVTANATMLARSQEVIVPSQQHENILTPLNELQSPFDSIHDSGQPGAIGVGSSQAAASEQTEKGEDKGAELRVRNNQDEGLKKESAHALSSENSHQNTRSAVDKGNLVQRDTDPSEGEDKNQGNDDSQQSSHMSQYFHPIEPEDVDHVSISKEIILENDEDCDSGVNADLMHLQQQTGVPPPQGRVFDTEMVEQSKESTDLHAASSRQLLEHSRSKNHIVADPVVKQASKGQINTAQSVEVLWSLKGSEQKADDVPSLSLIEGTPQFQGSSPIMLENCAEESTNYVNNQQTPNYESDNGINDHQRSTGAHQTAGSIRNVTNSVNEEVKMTQSSRDAEENKGLVSEQRLKKRTPQHESDNDIYANNSNYELSDTMNILNQNSLYDPRNGTPQAMSIATISADHIPQTNLASKEDIIKIIQEGKDEEETESNQKMKVINENGHRDSGEMKIDVGGRGSSRFSKGFDGELDRVADRINHSIMLDVNESSVIGDSFSRQKPELDARDEDPYENRAESDQGNIRLSQDSSSLPRHARTMPKKIERSSTTQSKKRTVDLSQQRRVTDPTYMILVREQDTPASAENSSTIQSRRNNHLNEPKFPEPVEEARQRFSTPGTPSRSPISDKNIKLAGSFKLKSVRGSPGRAYPVEIRKHHVIRGPVLKEHYDQHATIKSGKLKLASKSKVKMSRMIQRRLSKQQQQQFIVKEATTDESLMLSSIRQARVTSTGTNNLCSGDSFSPSITNEPESCHQVLPKRRIKRKMGRVKSSEDDAYRSDALSNRAKSKTSATPIKEARANAPQSLLNGRRDIRMGKKSLQFRDGKVKSKVQTQNVMVRQNMAVSGGQTFMNSSLNEFHDISMISSGGGVPGLQNNSQAMQSESFFPNFDKKVTPKCPQAVKYDKPTDFVDQNFRTLLPVAHHSTIQQMSTTQQIQQQDIEHMPIEQLYKTLSENWGKDQMMFEQKCQQVLNESMYETAQKSSTILSNDEAKTRQERFEVLKKRLLASQHQLKSKQEQQQQQQYQVIDDCISLQQADLNQNYWELDQMFTSEEQKQSKPKQKGQFQFIFNKLDERFQLPSSPSTYSNPPTSIKHQHPNSAHQSQIQLRLGSMTSGAVMGVSSSTFGGRQARQQSQVLSLNQIGNNGSNRQVMAINPRPVQNIGHFQFDGEQQPAMSAGQKGIFFENQSKSLNTTTLAGLQTRRMRHAEYKNSINVPQIPSTQYVRAATAKNAAKKRGNNFNDQFNSSTGFKSSASMKRKLVSGQGSRGPQKYSHLPDVSPASVGQTTQITDQRRIMQKLQYRSMRGRRIKDFLKQVQSQKLNNVGGAISVNQIKSGLIETPSDVTELASGNSGGLALNMALHSQSTINNQQHEDYTGKAETTKAVINNKLKGPWSDAQSESNNSINQLESFKNGDWLLSGKKAMSGVGGNGSNASDACRKSSSNLTSRDLLSSFLAAQDKRIDFGLCPLYKKVRTGNESKLTETEVTNSGQKILSIEQLESLISFIKRKNLQTLTRPFQLRTHQDAFYTVQKLLTEMGMGYRAKRMQRDETLIDIERVYVMTCRAHKLYRARNELIVIIKGICELEALLPRVKQLVMGKLATQQNNNSQVNLIADDDQVELENKAGEMRQVLSSLVLNIPCMLKDYKFFNNSFVFNDKDYLKYLGKEFGEVKNLLGVCNIPF